MKAQISLDYIIRIIILLVVVAVVISMILKFSDDIKRWVSKLFKPETTPIEFPKKISGDTFNSGEIAAFIESCYNIMNNLPETEQGNIDCYILVVSGNFNADANSVLAELSPEVSAVTTVLTNFNRDLIIIRFVDIGNKIEVTDT